MKHDWKKQDGDGTTERLKKDNDNPQFRMLGVGPFVFSSTLAGSYDSLMSLEADTNGSQLTFAS